MGPVAPEGIHDMKVLIQWSVFVMLSARAIAVADSVITLVPASAPGWRAHAWPVLDRLIPQANAVGIGPTAVSAVAAAATAQGAPTIVWYGVSPSSQGPGQQVLFRAWSNGRIEARRGRMDCYGSGPRWESDTPTCNTWTVVSDPAQGLTFDADLNFDEAVDGNDLGMMLAKWGPAPRNPVPPSDCPLALINP